MPSFCKIWDFHVDKIHSVVSWVIIRRWVLPTSPHALVVVRQFEFTNPRRRALHLYSLHQRAAVAGFSGAVEYSKISRGCGQGKTETGL
jgi:hypothetical protein